MTNSSQFEDGDAWNQAMVNPLRHCKGGIVDKPLDNVRVLLVEDDPIIALDLSHILELAGAIVVGPAHDLVSASALLTANAIDVAVLDHLIVGGDSIPVAKELSRRGLGFVFHTSHRGMLPQQFPDTPVIDKPSRPGELVTALKSLVQTSWSRR